MGDCICVRRGDGPEGCGICNETGVATHPASPQGEGSSAEAHPPQPDALPGDLRERVAAIIDANKYEAWTVDRANQMADAILSIIQPEEDKKRVAELLETNTRYLLRARKSEELLQTLIDKSMGHIHTRHLTDAQEHLKDPWA